MKSRLYDKSKPSSAFTLIELLVVIGIIALLAAILLPAMNAAFAKAEKAQAQAELKSLETAIRSYFNEYSKLPAEDAWQGDPDKFCTESDSKAVISRLIVNPTGPNLGNPRKIVFLDLSSGSTDGTFLDPWGTQYAVYLDLNYSGVLDSRSGITNVYAPGVAVSAGPDARFDNSDDLFSFR